MLQRISIVGVPGSGKSTTGRALAELLDAPFNELDSVFHRPGWTRLAVPEFQVAVGRLVAEDRWVVDGNYSDVRDLVWARADTIIWLDRPRVLATARVLRRTLRRVSRREELWNGNRERWTNLLRRDPERNIVLWAWTKHPMYRRQYGAAMAERGPDGQDRIVVRTSEQLRLLLAEVAEQAADQATPGRR